MSNIRATKAELEKIKAQDSLEKERKAQEETRQKVERAAKKAEADSLYSKGYEATLTNATTEAMDNLNTSLNLYQELEDRPNQVRALIAIGRIYALKEQYSDAKRRYDEALEIAQASHDFQAEGRVLEKFAAIQLKQGNREHAIQYYMRAQKAYQKAQDPQSEARVLEQVAINKETQGNFIESRTKYNAALSKYRSADDQIGISRVLSALSWGFLLDLTTAEIYLLKGNEIKIGRNVATQDVLNDISFSNRLVSRRHLVIRRDLSLEDLRSRNGTSVNGAMLPYGVTRRLVDKDVITLANVRPLQFMTGRPAKDFHIPLKAWGIFINNSSRNYQYLTEPEYSVLLSNGNLSLKEGVHELAAMKLRKPELVGPQMFEITDDWHIQFTVKETDYDYKEYTLRDGIWTEAIDLPLKYMKLTADLKTTVEEGPSFQIVNLR
jgi:tetratricopeptide (TPR) repeat protein